MGEIHLYKTNRDFNWQKQKAITKRVKIEKFVNDMELELGIAVCKLELEITLYITLFDNYLFNRF